MESVSKKINNISFYRFVATILVFLFHISFCFQTNSNSIFFEFSKFVQGLSCLSGFLYATKKLDDCKSFYKKNTKKVLFPVIVALLLTVIITFIIWLFNVNQNYLSLWFGYSAEGKLLFLYGNLWYIPCILICYFMTPIFYKAKIEKKFIYIFLTALSLIIEIIIACVYKWFPVVLMCYALGYFIGSIGEMNERLKSDKYHLLDLFISFLAVILFYILYKQVGYPSILGNIFVSLSGASTLFFIAHLFKVLNKSNKLDCLLRFSDKIAFPFYISNQIFMCGVFAIARNYPMYICLPITFGLTFMFALVIYYLSNLKINFKTEKIS